MIDRLPDIALSIRQPWVWAIAKAGKPVENRTWSTNFRGRFCIHASAGLARREYDDFVDFYRDLSSHVPGLPHSVAIPAMRDIERGGIVATASLVDCVSRHASPWFFGPYGFVLADVAPVPFIPVKGKLGFFSWRPRQIADPHGALL